MYSLGGKGYIDIKIDNFFTNTFTFNYFKANSYADLRLPIAEVSINTTTLKPIAGIKKNNTKIVISYGRDTTNNETYNYLIKDFLVKQDKNKYNVILYLVADYSNILYNFKQDIYDTLTSDLVLKALSINKSIDYIGADQQIWIRHFQSDYEWIRRVLKNSYIANSLAIGAYSNKTKLIVKDIKKELDKSEKHTFSNTSKEGVDYIFDSYQIESNFALAGDLVTNGKEYTFLNLVDSEYYSYKADSIYDEKNTNNFNNVIFDNDNTYKDYYKSEISNLTTKIDFFSMNVYGELKNTFFKSSELDLLDVVRVNIHEFVDNIDSQFSGKYLVTEKSIYISKEDNIIKNRFRFNRL